MHGQKNIKQKIGLSCLPYVGFCVNIRNNFSIVLGATERLGEMFRFVSALLKSYEKLKVLSD